MSSLPPYENEFQEDSLEILDDDDNDDIAKNKTENLTSLTRYMEILAKLTRILNQRKSNTSIDHNVEIQHRFKRQIYGFTLGKEDPVTKFISINPFCFLNFENKVNSTIDVILSEIYLGSEFAFLQENDLILICAYNLLNNITFAIKNNSISSPSQQTLNLTDVVISNMIMTLNMTNSTIQQMEIELQNLISMQSEYLKTKFYSSFNLSITKAKG